MRRFSSTISLPYSMGMYVSVILGRVRSRLVVREWRCEPRDDGRWGL